MPRILLPILFLFVSVGLNAQQVFYSNDLTELETQLPINDSICKAMYIDSISVKIYYCTNSKGTTKKYISTVVYVLNNGKPERVYRKETDSINPRNPYYRDFDNSAIYSSDEIWFRECSYDDNYVTHNTFENTVTSVYKDEHRDYSRFDYRKFYFQGKKLRSVTFVNGIITPREGFTYNIYSLDWVFKNGLLTNIVYKDKKSPKHEKIQFRCIYKKGLATYVEFNPRIYEDAFWLTKSYVNYYSKGKKVKLK